MKFTFEEWKFIEHCIERGKDEYEEMMNDSELSDKATSNYQIFKQVAEKANLLLEKIRNCEL